jgi:glycerol uptake facilitator-like aquaporin
MPQINRNTILRYLYDQLTGNFAGFIVGMMATKVVSGFFETRSIRNMWGLTSKKTVVDKETFSNIELIISIVIGFVFFEIVTKFIKEKTQVYGPIWKRQVFRWVIANRIHHSIGSFVNHARRRTRRIFHSATRVTLP